MSEQSSISFSDSHLTTWLILSLILMMAVLFFNLSCQYEMEKENTRLKVEQTELLERDFQTPVQEIIQTIWTGDEATDYLINNKMALAGQQHIQTNALEATSKTQSDIHFINLTIRRINHMLIIKVENDCENIPLCNNENLQTTKSASSLHSWELKSACAAAERYDGTIETTCSGNLFCAVATLSYDSGIKRVSWTKNHRL